MIESNQRRDIMRRNNKPMNERFYIQHYHAPCGELLLGEYDGKLCLCDWQTEKHHKTIINRLQEKLHTTLKDEQTDFLKQVKQQLDEYFNCKRQHFDIPFLLIGTDFQKTVWQALLTIPYGTTISYKTLAKQIGMPHSVRAVANANGANAISIIIPCHRVIGANGSLTGYGGGLPIKQYLLEQEQNTLFKL